MKKSIFLLCMLLIAACSKSPPINKSVDGNQLMSQVLESIDFDHPGRGLADYPSDDLVDVPKSYALILLGSIDEAKSKKIKSINDLGFKAGEWLMENSDVNQNGIIGWGVPVAWDAYGDGSINPENTEYSISTAIVVDALLGWADYVSEDKKKEIFSLVEKSLMPYLSESMRTPAGLLPYSLLVQDRKYDTFNSAVYLAGQLQRFSKKTNSIELKKSLESSADATMLALLHNKKIFEKNGSWYWNYSIQENNPNDLPHAGYIVEGILVYMENQGRFSKEFDREKVFDHLMDFFDKSGKVRGWPVFRPDIPTLARLYDLSIASQLMCRFTESGNGNVFLGDVALYKSPEGGFLKYPYGQADNKKVAEYESYLYRALNACGFHKSEYAQ